jgi:threonyl-tRNA synthetase
MLGAGGIRAVADTRNEKLGKKIREAQLQKIPYMLVVGDQEVDGKTVNPRTRKGLQLDPMTVEEFISMAHEECREQMAG